MIYIRADGNNHIGLGHLVRVFALAQMLKDEFSICFVSADAPQKYIDNILISSFNFIKIEKESDFIALLKKEDIVVLDGYHFGAQYQQLIKTKGCRIVCIDDLKDKEFHADVIINHAPGAVPNDYNAQPYTEFALGLDYALLRPVFLKHAKDTVNVSTDAISTIFICFGGSDSRALTPSVVQHVIDTCNDIKSIIVVTGEKFEDKLALKQIADNYPSVRWYHAVEESEIYELMCQSQVAIVPASGILYETSICIPTVISGYYVDNQRGIYEGFKKLEAILPCEEFDLKKLDMHLRVSIQSVRTKKVIDGLSGYRLLQLFKTL